MEYFDSLDTLLQTFWYVAIPASLIFIIQTIMTFVGVDSSDGINADFDGDISGVEAPFQLFSLRNLVNFLLGFSWTGISFFNSIPNQTLLISLSVGVGTAFVYLFFLIIQQVQKLAENNSFQMSSVLNRTAEVYLTIPEQKKGKGKILISIKGAFHELDAITENEKIPSGAMVKVVGIENGEIPIVKTL